MANWKVGLTVVSVAAIAFVAGRSIPAGDAALAAQEGKKPEKAAQPDKPAQAGKKEGGGMGAADDKMREMMEKMAAQMQPGPEHKTLDALLGDWEGTVKFWMEPGAPPMESTGTVHREWTLDGRFIRETVDAPPMGGGGPPFKGLGMLGYNTIERRYEMAWFENMATWISTSNGRYDVQKKALVMEGDELDPATGKRRHARMTLDLSRPDRQTMEGWCTGSDGKDFKSFEGDFKKKGH